MTKSCPIVEDLLPMYQENLLQDETKQFVDEHLSQCKKCRQRSEWSSEVIAKGTIQPSYAYDKMMAKTQLKLSLYQMLLISISFLLVVRSVVIKQDFSFILSYTLLGFLIYVFYKKYRYVFLISFLPALLWFLATIFYDLVNSAPLIEEPNAVFYSSAIFSSFLFASFHLMFALIGATIALFTLKLFKKEELT